MLAWLRKYRGRAVVLSFCAFLPLLMAPGGGFPSRPKFQQVTIGQCPALLLAAGSATYYSQCGVPRWNLWESGATANNRLWRIFANGEQLYITATNDGVSSETPVLRATRSGGVATSVNFPTAANIEDKFRYTAATQCTGAGTQGPGYNATCTRTGTGLYQVTFSQNLGGGNCVVGTTDNTTTGLAKTGSTPGTTVNVTTFVLSAGTYVLGDVGWSIQCTGP